MGTLAFIAVASCFGQDNAAERSALERGDAFTLIKQEVVLADLEVTREQNEYLKELARHRAREIGKTGLAFDRASPEERAGVNTAFRTKMQGFDADLLEFLTPPQRARLKQIMAQCLTRADVKTFGLLHPEVKKSLAISVDQEGKIEKVGEEAKSAVENKIAELQEQIAKMRSDARNQMLNQLTKDQKEKFESLFGKPIQFKR